MRRIDPMCVLEGEGESKRQIECVFVCVRVRECNRKSEWERGGYNGRERVQ